MMNLDRCSISLKDRGPQTVSTPRERTNTLMDDQPPLVAMVAKRLSLSNPLSSQMLNHSTDLLHLITSDSFTSASWFRFTGSDSVAKVLKEAMRVTTVLFFSASSVSMMSLALCPIKDVTKTCHSGVFYQHHFHLLKSPTNLIRLRCRYSLRCRSWCRGCKGATAAGRWMSY